MAKIKRSLALILLVVIFTCLSHSYASPFISKGQFQDQGIIVEITFSDIYKIYRNPKNKRTTHKRHERTEITLQADKDKFIANGAYVMIDGKKHVFQGLACDKQGFFTKSRSMKFRDHHKSISLVCKVSSGKLVTEVKKALHITRDFRITRRHVSSKLIISDVSLKKGESKARAYLKKTLLLGDLGAKMIVEQATYKLNLAGKSSQQFAEQMKRLAKQAKTTGAVNLPVKPTEIRIFLELQNLSRERIDFELGGDSASISVDGQGAGFISVPTATIFTEEERAGKVITLWPGQTHRWQLSMTSGYRNSIHHFWTIPGKCTMKFEQKFRVLKISGQRKSDFLTIQASDVVVNISS